MKKIFAIVSLVVLSACGGNGASTEVTTTDSSTVVVDSIKVDSAPKVEEDK
jgi:hypothetical protein